MHKPIFQRVYVTFEKNFVQFGLKDLIVKNLYNVPFIEKLKMLLNGMFSQVLCRKLLMII